ncbi:gustatory and odorant receptor 22-like [Glossina fuscipes]|uniref:Gustatory receptor n=1 Tax=Glossina fuscipes TaxID=7396 RepID=A0A9C6DWM4_9MUSC|nr:gustatory and odorant receptor 22-like [Glossina fuscipes]
MDIITEQEFDSALDLSILTDDMEKLLKSEKRKKFIKNSNHNPDLMERLTMRAKRAKLKSRHGQTAELYDQFYRDHKLLLKLFVILGVMPLARQAGRVTFSWKSYQMYYAFIFYILTTLVVLKVGSERVKLLRITNEYDEYIYAIIFILFLLPHFWIPYVGWGVASQVAKYKSMWGTFQVRYYRVTGTTLVFPTLKIAIVILFIGCVLLSILFLFSLSQLLDDFLLWHTTAYFHIITMINMNAALFYINSKGTKIASKSLSDCFRKDMRVECNYIMIKQYRLLWLNLSEILQALGNAYARTYCTYCLFMSINITIGSYGALSEILEFGFSYKVLGLVVLTIYCASLLFIICDCAQSATSVMAEGVQSTLLSLNLLQLDVQTQKEIDHFISAIELNPPVVNLRGYALINRELLTATISTIAIYLIVLLQFKLSIVAQKCLQDSLQSAYN